MRRHAVVQSGETVTQRVVHFADFIGRAIHGAAHQQKHTLRLQTFRFSKQGLRCRLAVNNALYCCKHKHAGKHGNSFQLETSNFTVFASLDQRVSSALR